MLVKRGRALVDARSVVILLREGDHLVVTASAGVTTDRRGHRVSIAGSTSGHVLERLRSATLVEAVLHTGRTHQIRVHFQFLGFPLVGDATYGNRQNQRLAELTGYTAPRQMLHAWRLAFIHPRTAKRLSLEAPRPEDFLDALAALRCNGS